MSNELTYILGAGASYQSIPVVKTFPKRFEEFLNAISQLNNHKSHIYTTLYHQGKIFLNEIKSHQSFDTYFKKLFHTNKFELIDQGKRILNLYFIWEHLEDDEETKYANSSTLSDKKIYTELDFHKSSKLDKRYDALIAGLLKSVKGKAEVFTKTNFITWNYDLNLFFSLKNYFAPERKVKDFLDSISIDEFEWNIDNQISVINMNGYFYSSGFDDLLSLHERQGISIIEEKLSNGFFELPMNKDAELIKFAWESELKQAKIAKEKIAASKNIVSIGYTFPLYNRLVDFGYLETNDLGLNKKVIIQDPNADKIRQNLLDLFNLNDSKLLMQNIVSNTDCESFYVPSNIYGRKDHAVYSFVG